MRETRVPSLGREDHLEKEMAIHSSIAWKIPWTEEPNRLYSPWGCKESDTTEHVCNALGSRVTSEHLFCVKFQVAFGGPRNKGDGVLTLRLLTVMS